MKAWGHEIKRRQEDKQRHMRESLERDKVEIKTAGPMGRGTETYRQTGRQTSELRDLPGVSITHLKHLRADDGWHVKLAVDTQV